VEQYLRLTTNSAQTDWSDWLGIATTVHNNHKNATINIAPSEALLGYTPRLHPVDPPPSLNQHVEDRKQTALERRAQAVEAINRTAHQTPPPQFKVDQEVWLEAKNLQLPYQTPKLAPKRHGPFLLPSPRPWDFPPSIDRDVSREDSPMELDEPEGVVSLD
jgi:hypothetical protein